MSHLFCERIMKRFRKDMAGVIKPNQCFTNAVIAAQWFNQHGFYVEVVEGWFNPNEFGFSQCDKIGMKMFSEMHPYMNEPNAEHRFCKKGDKYFDPTLELLFGFEITKWLDYTAVRLYDYEEMIDYMQEIKDTFGGDYYYSASTLTGCTYFFDGKEDIPIYWGHIGEDGYFVKPQINPYEYRASLMRQLC